MIGSTSGAQATVLPVTERIRSRCLSFSAWDVEPEAVEHLSGFGDLPVRLLSRDPLTGSATSVVELPPQWRQGLQPDEATIEFFVLKGDLTVEGNTVGAGGYAHLPQGTPRTRLQSDSGATALYFWNPNLPSFPPPFHQIRVTKAWNEPIRNRIPGSYQSFFRSLRLPDFTGEGFDGGPGGFLRMAWMSPGFVSPYQHVHHESWEECFVLGGDLFNADIGISAPGSYISIPQEMWHGMVATQQGALIISHSNAPMTFPWTMRDYPLGREIVENVLDSLSLGRPPERQNWSEMALARWQERPEFRTWYSNPDYSAWGNEERKEVSWRFRASWRRSTSSTAW